MAAAGVRASAPVGLLAPRAAAGSSRVAAAAPRASPLPRAWARGFVPASASPLQLQAPRRVRATRSRALQAHAVAAPAAPQKVPAAFIPKNLHGFEVVRSEFISEYDAVAILYKHKKTGAEARHTTRNFPWFYVACEAWIAPKNIPTICFTLWK